MQTDQNEDITSGAQKVALKVTSVSALLVNAILNNNDRQNVGLTKQVLSLETQKKGVTKTCG